MDDMEEIMYRSGFDNSMSIFVAMRGPLDFRYRGTWRWLPYMFFTGFVEGVCFVNLLTIMIRFLTPEVHMMERLFMAFPLTSISLRCFRVGYLFLRRPRFARLMREYDSLYRSSPELNQDVASIAKVLRFIPRLLALLTALPMGPWCFMPILNAINGGRWAISVPSTWFFDPTVNIYTFAIVVGLQSLCAGFSTLRVVLFDNMYYCYTCRQLALAKHLSRELARILSILKVGDKGEQKYLNFDGRSLSKYEALLHIKGELKQWVKNHQHSLRLSDELQAIFSPWLLFQYTSIGISCCTTAFVVVFSDSDLLNIVLCFIYVIGNSLELLITCRLGDLITEELEKPSPKINMLTKATTEKQPLSLWLEAPLFSCVTVNPEKTKNLEHATDGTHIYQMNKDIYKPWMSIILTRAAVPIKLSALGVFPLNTETFKNIMVTTYSFFTLLTSMKERQERSS